MNEEQFSYIANHLSIEECSKLIGSLQFTAYDFPINLKSLETIPNNATCFKLLANFSKGKKPWRGENKSHEVIAHRLRQIGKGNLADWLGNAVFHHLAKDINDSLLQNPFAESCTQSALNTKLHQDKETFGEAEWDLIDITLWIVLASLLASLVFSCCRILCLSCTRCKRQSTNEEMKVLLK
ncbi:jg21481 [Pararge aegeria aegeria]|uniref:Jg21481 protein n=2 Tax=Pararge aegeria TaxID=116150 RepID=A0A8S4RPP3_9NEOP|nr:jg21481 [Pararge aegeria aegeria]